MKQLPPVLHMLSFSLSQHKLLQLVTWLHACKGVLRNCDITGGCGFNYLSVCFSPPALPPKKRQSTLSPTPCRVAIVAPMRRETETETPAEQVCSLIHTFTRNCVYLHGYVLYLFYGLLF